MSQEIVKLLDSWDRYENNSEGILHPAAILRSDQSQQGLKIQQVAIKFYNVLEMIPPFRKSLNHDNRRQRRWSVQVYSGDPVKHFPDDAVGIPDRRGRDAHGS